MATVSPDTGQLRLVRLISRQVSPIHCRGRRCGSICWVFKMYFDLYSRRIVRRAFALLALALTALTTLSPAAELPVMVVTGNRYEVPLSSVLTDVSVISRADIEDSQAASLADLLVNEVGLEFARNGGPGTTTSFFLRGTESKNIVILIDGVRTPVDGIGSLFAVNTPLTSIERIEVLRGNGGALFGDAAIGGVIQIFTKTGIKEQTSLSSTVAQDGGLEASLQLVRQIDSTTYRLSAGGFQSSRVSAMNPSIASSAGANPDADQTSGNYLNAGLDINGVAGGTLGISLKVEEGETEYDDVYYAATADSNIEKSSRETVNLAWDREVSESWSTQVSINRLRQASRYLWNGVSPRGQSDGYISGETSSNQTTLQWTNELQLENPFDTTVVFWAEGVNAKYRADAPADGYDADRDALGFFIGQTSTIGPYTLQANGRSDRVSVVDRGKGVDKAWRTNPWLIGAGQRLSERWRIASTVSRGYRAPSVYDVVTDSSLTPEDYLSKEISAGYSSDETDMRFVLFHWRTPNAIVSDPPAAFPLRALGVEWSGRTNLNRSTRLSWAFTAQDAKNTRTWSPASRRAQHYGNVGITKHLTSGNQLGWKFRFAGPRDNSEWDDVQLKSYTVLDVSLERQLRPDLSLAAKIENVGDAFYELASGYNTVGRRVSLRLTYQMK
jgi:vitamin B12 transporter